MSGSGSGQGSPASGSGKKPAGVGSHSQLMTRLSPTLQPPPEELDLLQLQLQHRAPLLSYQEGNSLYAGIGRSRMESVSRVAIRNIKPPQLDPNDPDQKRLIDKMKYSEAAKIWSYSDNKPSFLAKLNKNNPTGPRMVIESIVNKEPFPGDRVGLPKPEGGGDSEDDDSDSEETGTSTTDGPSVSRVSKPKAHLIPAASQTEMKMILKKTLELIQDMNKSVELVFHAIRATARFLTYPTPSIPSDNYMFGHVRGWIFIMYMALSTVNVNCADCHANINEDLLLVRVGMKRLWRQGKEFHEVFKAFHGELTELHDAVRKEAKSLRGKGPLWTGRMDGYLKYSEEVKSRKDLLLNIKEDRPFSTDWVFHPHPSQASLNQNSFHFQWVKPKREWKKVDFEVRSDYSTRWHPYSSFSPSKQIALILRIIDHLTIILVEATNFARINVRLSFDIDEIKCLRLVLAEINSLQKIRKNTGELLAEKLRKMFEDLSLLTEISREIAQEADQVKKVVAPCFEAFRKHIGSSLIGRGGKVKIHTPQPLWRQDETDSVHPIFEEEEGLCLCCNKVANWTKSVPDFEDVYGQPMKAVFLRTPASDKIIEDFFPKENLIPSSEPDSCHTSHRISKFGTSEGYISSLFDEEIGREAPHNPPKRLPKIKQKSEERVEPFSAQRLIRIFSNVMKKGELDIEVYLQIFDEIRKFFKPFGTSFNFILIELSERLENLENRLYSRLSEYYETLEKMVEYEASMGIVETDPVTCGTRAFRRIHTVLEFFILFLLALKELGEYDGTATACRQAYYKSYAKYHSWFVQKTSMFSVYSIPTKVVFYEKVMPGMETKVVDDAFLELIQEGDKIYRHCEQVFKDKQTVDL